MVVFHTRTEAKQGTSLYLSSVLSCYVVLPPSLLAHHLFLCQSLLLDLLLISVQLCHFSLLCPIQVQSVLLPPPPRHPRPWPLIQPLTEFQNRSRRNILRNRILPPPDIVPGLLKARFCHFPSQKRIVPSPIPPPHWLPTCESSHNPVLKTTQCPLHPGGQDPRLLPKQQYCLNYRLESLTGHLWICPLPAQNTQHSPPTLPRLLEVSCHFRKVIISRRYHPSSQVQSPLRSQLDYKIYHSCMILATG